MIHEILPGLLALEVPEGIENLEYHDEGFRQYLTYHAWMGTEDYDILRSVLPPGTWSILGPGTADKITEQEWGTIVEKVTEKPKFAGDKSRTFYKDYRTGAYLFRLCPSQSGLSLLKLHGLNPSTTVLLTNKK